MPNAVIERLETQRAEQINFVDTLLNRVDSEGRDLVDAEQSNLTAARQRITEIDAQLAPLRDFEGLRADSAAGARSALVGGATTEPRPLGMAGGGAFPYRSAGAFLVDHLRSQGPFGAPVDAAAAARLTAAITHQITTDTPGLLPAPIVGPIVDTLDASRPLITSLGAKPLGGIAGAGFSRPKITQHVLVGEQLAEKTELASRVMKIVQVPFTKGTYGGAVNISRQDIDWTSPAAWDALVADLARVYGAQTELVTAQAFAAAVVQTVDVASNDLAGWAGALYEGAVMAYLGGAAMGTIPNGQLPDHIWCSLDMWAQMGAIVDAAKLVVSTGPGTLGTASGVTDFAGDVLNAPRTVVPTFPAETVIIGSSAFFEFYEDQIGLLSAVEPKQLGIEVAYGGYTAHGMIEANCFCKLTKPVIPLSARKSA
jgi:hypothetical protein